ncbi:hypothetical protein [Pseudomonas sp.]|uniref:hypothetical protein n=1 Tax=Pseudomonas sp. TaxID=306 RepID=UPI003C78B971
MPLRWLTTLGLMIGLQAAPAFARTLDVELDIQHIGGLLPAAELDSMLASPTVQVSAIYKPRWLIPGITARRESTLPLGSKLLPILQRSELSPQQIARRGRTLSFSVSEKNAEHRGYTLANLQLFLPMADGPGRPQPSLEIILPELPPSAQAQQHALLTQAGSIELGMRLRYRWSDAQAVMTQPSPRCSDNAQIIDHDHYRFRPRHSHAGLFRHLAAQTHSGQRNLQLAEPLPSELQGWVIERQQLVQLPIDNVLVERLSLLATREASAQCQHSRSYEALFADGQLVEMQYSGYHSGCADDSSASQWLAASWLNDGSLAQLSSTQGQAPSNSWDAFALSQTTHCQANNGQPAAQPAPDQLQALQVHIQSVQRLRQAFLTD